MDSSKIVSDFEKYKLPVQIRGDHTLQRTIDSTTGLTTWQTWRRGRSLGHGASGAVHQQVWEDEHHDLHYRAVKVCLVQTLQTTSIGYKRELSALAAFSNSEVSTIASFSPTCTHHQSIQASLSIFTVGGENQALSPLQRNIFTMATCPGTPPLVFPRPKSRR